MHLTKRAAVELAKELIAVNCICPGGINRLLRKHIPGGEATTLQILRITQPLARPGTTEVWFVYRGRIISATGFGTCLDAINMANGTQLVVNPCNGATSQQWQIK